MNGRGWDPELLYGAPSDSGTFIWWLLGAIAVFLLFCALNPDNFRHATTCGCPKCKQRRK